MAMAPVMNDLRAAVKASSWSQADVCRALELSRSQICQFYSGKRGLSAEKAEQLAKFLGLEIVVRPKGKVEPKAKKGKQHGEHR